MDQIRISAKNLGYLALPHFCPRCFWLKMRCKNRLPYQIFPGIFSSIDGYTKKVTNRCYEYSKALPVWFEGFPGLLKPVPTPPLSRFFIVDPETNVKLTGIPDEIFQRMDGSYFIADYKTARFTGSQDELMPIYRTQLNAYAYIAERCGLNPVSGLGLIYYEPQTDLQIGLLGSVLLKDGFMMLFKGKLLEIELDAKESIPPLLKEMRRICECKEPPKSRDGCGDCILMGELISLLR